MQNKNVQSELVEKYVMGKLSPSDAESFENELSKNSALKSEVSLQKAIQEALIQERKAELKAMLQAVAVGATPTIYTWLRYAAVSAGVGIGVFLGFQQFGGKNAYVPQSEITKTTNNKKVENVIATKKEESVISEPIIETTKKLSTKAFTKRTKVKKIQSKEIEKEEVINLPEIDHNEEHQGLHNQPFKNASSHEMPNGNIAHSISESGISDVSVKNDVDKFHYKFNGEKLILVGDFSEGQYEILELNKNHKKSLYLYYQKEFYSITNNNLELSPLQKLENNQIRKELKNKLR